jgi:hypothetical protein
MEKPTDFALLFVPIIVQASQITDVFVRYFNNALAKKTKTAQHLLRRFGWKIN